MRWLTVFSRKKVTERLKMREAAESETDGGSGEARTDVKNMMYVL